MLDRDILTDMLKNVGSPTSHIRRDMAAIVTRAQSLYAKSCPNLKTKVCPGARMLLYRLHRSGIPAGLVTGNLTRIGWTKMERSGLKQYLQFGAFAELARDRARLVKIAVRHAREQGWIDRHTTITLIGDHPNDIGAAKANGVRSVAVATGVVGSDELAKHSPDILVPDMRALSVHHFLGEA
jgi:phosphoglycolate phosphatase-like HAD superfamily hydrolase